MKLTEIIESILFLALMFGLVYAMRYADLVNSIIINLKGV